MGNMSYCRFQNTYKDLQDCLSALNKNEAETLSDKELVYANMMMQLCEDFVHCHEDEVREELENRKLNK
jgi:hypothetical protein